MYSYQPQARFVGSIRRAVAIVLTYALLFSAGLFSGTPQALAAPTPEIPKGIYSFNNNIEAGGSADTISGTVTWSAYGVLPSGTQVSISLYDGSNERIGAPLYDQPYNASTNSYKYASIPVSGAKRIGIELLDGSTVIAKQTIPLWIYPKYMPASWTIADGNPGSGIDATIRFGAAQDPSVAIYKIYYQTRADSTLRLLASLPSGSITDYVYHLDRIPVEASQLLIAMANSAGEEAPVRAALTIIDDLTAETATEAVYSSGLPVSTNVTLNAYYTHGGAVSGYVNWTVPSVKGFVYGFKLYTMDDQGRKLAPLAFLVYNGQSPTYYYNFNGMTPLAAGSVSVAVYTVDFAGKESATAPTAFIVSPISFTEVSLTDTKISSNKFTGTVSWSTSAALPAGSLFRIGFFDKNGQKVKYIAAGDGPNVYTMSGLTMPSEATHIGLEVFQGDTVLTRYTVPILFDKDLDGYLTVGDVILSAAADASGSTHAAAVQSLLRQISARAVQP